MAPQLYCQKTRVSTLAAFTPSGTRSWLINYERAGTLTGMTPYTQPE